MYRRRYLRIAIRWVPVAIVGAVIAGLVAYLVLSAQPRVYEASSTLKLGQALSGSPILLTQVSDRLLTEYAYRGTSLATMAQVSESLGLDVSVTDLRKNVTTQVEPASTLLTITARANSSEEAVQVANAIGEQLIATNVAAQANSTVQQALLEDIEALRAEIDTTRAAIAELSAKADPTVTDQDRIAELEDVLVDRIDTNGTVVDRLASTGAHSLAFVSQATLPESPIEPRPLLYTGLAIFTGLLIVMSIAALVEYFDDTLRRPEDLEEVTGLPTLGNPIEFSKNAKRGGENRLVTVTHPRSSAAEEYRRLRANLEIVASGDRLRLLVVTGSEPEVGIPVVAANVAVAFAESGLRVMLIDADLRDPTIHAFFNLRNDRGLSTLLAYDTTKFEQVSARTWVPNLEVITTGNVSSVSARALGTSRLRSLLVQMHGRVDIVIVASPALPTFSDALLLASELKDTLLVVTRGRTRRGDVQQAVDALGIAHARVLGTALFTQQRGASPRGSRVQPTSSPPEESKGSDGAAPERQGFA